MFTVLCVAVFCVVFACFLDDFIDFVKELMSNF